MVLNVQYCLPLTRSLPGPHAVRPRTIPRSKFMKNVCFSANLYAGVMNSLLDCSKATSFEEDVLMRCTISSESNSWKVMNEGTEGRSISELNVILHVVLDG